MAAPETQIINLAEKMMDRLRLRQKEGTVLGRIQTEDRMEMEELQAIGQPAAADSSQTGPPTAKALAMEREENPSQTEAKEEMISTTTLEWTGDLEVAGREWYQDIGVRVVAEDIQEEARARNKEMEQTTKVVVVGHSIPARNRKIRRESIPVMDTLPLRFFRPIHRHHRHHL